jgi:hypothetical protein
MAWKTWPRCTARPAAIQPLMAVDTDAARSSRCAREPSSCSEPSADSAGAGGGARGSLPELVKKVAAAEWIGSRRHRSNARSCINMAGATRRTPGAHDAPGPGPPCPPTTPAVTVRREQRPHCSEPQMSYGGSAAGCSSAEACTARLGSLVPLNKTVLRFGSAVGRRRCGLTSTDLNAVEEKAVPPVARRWRWRGIKYCTTATASWTSTPRAAWCLCAVPANSVWADRESPLHSHFHVLKMNILPPSHKKVS